jgi:hypothetical protein
MARKKIATERELGDMQAGVLKSITANVETLYRRHALAIEKVQDDSDEKKVSVTFSVLIDASDSAPKVRTRIRYCETVTDEVIDSLEDPAQPTLFQPEETKGRGRPRKTITADVEPKQEGDGE